MSILFDLAETKGHKYVIRLQSMAQAMADPLLNPKNLHKREVYYREFMYQTFRWKEPHRVVVKMDRPAGELLVNLSVTNTVARLKIDHRRRFNALFANRFGFKVPIFSTTT